MIWEVKYEPSVFAEIQMQLMKGLLRREDLEILSRWVGEIEQNGLEHVQNKFWNDHALEDQWKGLRSASFSLRGRIIYRVEERVLIVIVVRVTATHNYRK